MTVKAFCAERKLNYYTFKGWQRVFSREGVEQFRELAPTPNAEASYAVVLANGRELKVSAGFSITSRGPGERYQFWSTTDPVGTFVRAHIRGAASLGAQRVL